MARSRGADLGLVERAVPDAAAWPLAGLLQRRVPAGDLDQHLPDPGRRGDGRVHRIDHHSVVAAVRPGPAGQPIAVPGQWRPQPGTGGGRLSFSSPPARARAETPVSARG